MAIRLSLGLIAADIAYNLFGIRLQLRRCAYNGTVDLARAGLQQAALEVGGKRPCVAALVYMYDHEARDLPKRLTRDFHHRHDLAQTTLHVHLDHENCMEVTVLKGRGSDVQEFADHIIAERGVRHGHVVYPPASGADSHAHGETHWHGHERGHRRRAR